MPILKYKRPKNTLYISYLYNSLIKISILYNSKNIRKVQVQK